MYIFFSFSSESECVTYKRMVISQTPLSSNKVPGTNFRRFYSLLTPPLTPEEELTLQTAKIIVILFISCVKAGPPPMNNPIISQCQGHGFISFPGRLMPERKSFLSFKFWPLLPKCDSFLEKLSWYQVRHLNVVISPWLWRKGKRAELGWITMKHLVFYYFIYSVIKMVFKMVVQITVGQALLSIFYK